MGPEIGQTYLFLPMAKELWDAVMDTYSNLGNSEQIYKIWAKIKKLKQGNQGVNKYYNTLKGLWQELDLFYDFE